MSFQYHIMLDLDHIKSMHTNPFGGGEYNRQVIAMYGAISFVLTCSNREIKGKLLKGGKSYFVTEFSSFFSLEIHQSSLRRL